jgi:hypothetical protein
MGSERLTMLSHLLTGINNSFLPEEKQSPRRGDLYLAEYLFKKVLLLDLDSGWNFASYAHEVFQEIRFLGSFVVFGNVGRGLFAVHPQDYLRSLQVEGFERGLFFGKFQILESLDNSGRSGSFLYV